MPVTSDQQILLKTVIAYVDSRQLKVWVCVGMFQNLSGPVPAPSPHSPAPPTIRPGSAPPSRRRDVWKGSSSPPSGSPNLQDRNRQMEESWTEEVRGKKVWTSQDFYLPQKGVAWGAWVPVSDRTPPVWRPPECALPVSEACDGHHSQTMTGLHHSPL